MWTYNYTDELYHHGILGMKWGVRRYQNADGSYTNAGKRKYIDDRLKKDKKRLNNVLKTNYSSAEFKLDGRKIYTKEEAKAVKAYEKDKYKRREDRLSKHWDKTVRKLNTPMSSKKRIGANMVNGVIGVVGGYALNKAADNAFSNGKYKTYIALSGLSGLSTGAGAGSFVRATAGVGQRKMNKKYGVKN